LDQQKTKDGKPYAPYRFESLVNERYFITKNTHITYSDTGKLTPVERNYIIKYIADEIKKMNEQMKEKMSNINN